MKTCIKYIFIIITMLSNIVFASYNTIYIADIEYDWINKSEIEKESIISEIRDEIKELPLTKQTDFKTQFKDLKKDKIFKEHYLAASAGYKEYQDYKIAAFYAYNGKFIYMYALQKKDDLSKNFYYDALGNLRYIDFIHGDYPSYPYYSYQYSISGKPVSVIYFVSKDTQYMFEPNGDFKGVWYKYNMYDKHSKVILKRTSY